MESNLGVMETYGLQATVKFAISCSLSHCIYLGW